jgi:hypothetical protein
MKNPLCALQKATLSLVILLSLILSSCKEDEGPDTESPHINITSPGGEPFVKGDVPIQAQISDNRGVKSIKILIDGVFYKGVPGGTLNESWNSRLVEDGQHTIEIIAVDNEGNQQSASVDVNVLNYFITFVIPDTYLAATSETYYISKNDGTIVDVQVLMQGENLKFETPDDYEPSQTFVLTKVSHNENGVNVLNFLFTYPEFAPGTYHLKPYSWYSSIGSSSITLHNVPSNYATIYGGGLEVAGFAMNGDEDGGTIPFTVNLRSEPADAFIATSTSTGLPRYKLFENIGIGSAAEGDFNDMLDFDNVTQPVADNASFSLSVIKAVPSAGSDYAFDVSNHFIFFNFEEKKVSHYIPGNLYNDYIFFSSFYTVDAEFYAHTVRGATLPAEMTVLNAEVTSFSYDNSTMNLEATASSDFTEVLGYKDNSETVQNRWTVYLPGKASNSLKLTIPQELIDLYNLPPADQFTFNNARFVSMEGINGYSDYVNFLFNSNEMLMDVVNEITEASIPLAAPGGRKAMNKDNADPRMFLERANRMIRNGY